MAIVRPAAYALAALLLTACGAGAATASAGTGQRAGTAPVGGSAALRPTPASPPATVLAHARQAAGPRNRVDAPVQWVRTTLGAAWRTVRSGGDGDPARPVYVIQLQGRFCCHPGPAGHDPTSTSVFEIVPVDGHPADSLGGGTGHPLDLSRLGPVHTFTLH
jgi:hypothetical protein